MRIDGCPHLPHRRTFFMEDREIYHQNYIEKWFISLFQQSATHLLSKIIINSHLTEKYSRSNILTKENWELCSLPFIVRITRSLFMNCAEDIDFAHWCCSSEFCYFLEVSWESHNISGILDQTIIIVYQPLWENTSIIYLLELIVRTCTIELMNEMTSNLSQNRNITTKT